MLQLALRRFAVSLAICDKPRAPCAPAPNPIILPGELGACSRPSRFAPRAEHAPRLAAHAKLLFALRREIHIQTNSRLFSPLASCLQAISSSGRAVTRWAPSFGRWCATSTAPAAAASTTATTTRCAPRPYQRDLFTARPLAVNTTRTT